MAEKDKLGNYTNVEKKRGWFGTLLGETTNNKASMNTIEKDNLQNEIKSLETIEEEANKHGKNTLRNNLVFGVGGMTYNAGKELVKSYKEGDLTRSNILEKAYIGMNPRLAKDEYGNDALNQEVGSMINEARDTTKVLRDLQTSNPKLQTYANIEWENNLKSNSPFMEFALKNKIAKIEGNVIKIDESRISEMDKLQSEMSPKQQEQFAIWKASYPEERRLRDGQKRTSINPNLSPDDPLNKRAVSEAPIVTDLNDRDRGFLNQNWEDGADLHKEIADNNRDNYKEPDNFNYANGEAVSFKEIDEKTGEGDVWNKTDSGADIETFGDGKKNPLGLNPRTATSGVGLAMNGVALWLQQWWLAIFGIIIILGVWAYWYFFVRDETKVKTKAKVSSKSKSKSSSRKRKRSKKKIEKKSEMPISLVVNVNDYDVPDPKNQVVKEVVTNAN